ncbi:MAG: thioredoxin family protein [Candidatus Sumerlaeia bacterium]|nr:thioredoxin family protein [Candidatus Sumerlaeia bacterium]
MKPKAAIAVAAIILAAGLVVAVKQAQQRSRSDSGATASRSEFPPPPATLPRLLDIGAGKCIPCKMMAPILDGLKKEYEGRMDVVVIDLTEHPEASRFYDISLIPTQIFYDASGKELWRHEGFIAKEDILAKWKELGFDFQKDADK